MTRASGRPPPRTKGAPAMWTTNAPLEVDPAGALAVGGRIARTIATVARTPTTAAATATASVHDVGDRHRLVTRLPPSRHLRRLRSPSRSIDLTSGDASRTVHFPSILEK